MHLKKFIKILLCLQLTISPISKAEQREVFDFEGDVPDYIFSGEGRGDGRENGNCIGAGCDDISPEDSGQGEWYESPDRDENGSNDYDQNENQNDRDFDQSNDPDVDFTHETNERPRQIVTFDRDRGDGVIYVRDEKGRNYYRGPPSELVNDEQGDFHSKDHTDIYFDDKDQKYVKSDDGKSLINLNNLLHCAPSFDCEFMGFREDWWNYSMWPEFDSADEANEWFNLEHFSKKQFQIKTGIDKAWNDPSISRSPEKADVLQTAEFLYDEAKSAYEKSLHSEAYALQDGAAHLTSTLVDIGLGISPLGWAKDAYELISGKSIVTGQALTANERLLSGIGVMMPGVAGFAFAGMKIIARNPLSRQAIKNAAAQAEKISNFLGDLKPVRFREGKNTTEVAIIGRDMTYVKEAGNRLNAAGIKARIFYPSPEATKDLSDYARNFDGNFIPYEKIPNTFAHKENMDWIRQVKYDEIPLVDVGNPSQKIIPSRFYDDEIIEIFGKDK